MNRTLTATLALAMLVVALAACTTATVGPMERGFAYYKNGEYVAAADSFSDAIARDARSAAAWSNRAAARVRMGELNAAIADYNRAIDLAPGDAELYYNRANALVAAGQYDAAVGDYARAVELNPAYARAYFNRGTALAFLGRRDLAQADWTRAMEIEPDPWAKAAMRRSAGLDVPRPEVFARAPTDLPPNILAPAPPPGMGSAAVPPPRVPPTSPVASVPVPAVPQPAASPVALDARALASRAISRELDGDHAGAMQDLNAALAVEPDASRRAQLSNLIRLLDMPK